MSQILRDADTGGMSYYRIEGRGRSRTQPVAAARGTTRVTPEYIPRTKVEVIVRDDQIENLMNKFVERLRDQLGGKVFVTEVPIAVGLTANKRGEAAI